MKDVLMGSYFCTYISHLLNFDTDGVVLFDAKYFFTMLAVLKFNKCEIFCKI